MPSLTAEIFVECPKDSKRVNVKDVCLAPLRCPFFRHLYALATRAYLVCHCAEPPEKEEPEQPDDDPELDQMEEETTED